MISSTRRLASRVHMPLRRLALCLDCEECFVIGDDACPACGSETWTRLARFMESSPSDSLSRLLEGRHVVIVARHRGKLYDQLRRAMAGNPAVQVILDRREGERRQRAVNGTPDRRRRDRRSTESAEEQLRSGRWAMLVVDPTVTPLRRR